MTLYLGNVIGRESNICVTQEVNLRKDSEDILADPMYGLCKDQIPNKTKLLLLPKLPAQWELFPTLLEEILCQQRLLASARAAAPVEAKIPGESVPKAEERSPPYPGTPDLHKGPQS